MDSDVHEDHARRQCLQPLARRSPERVTTITRSGYKATIVQILNGAREDGGNEDAGPDVNNLRRAVSELQDAVIRLAEAIDRHAG